MTIPQKYRENISSKLFQNDNYTVLNHLDPSESDQLLQNYYRNEIIPYLKTKFDYKNVHEVPKLTKIVLNRTYGEKSNTKALQLALQELSAITGQKGVFTRSKKAIAGFQITKGDILGIRVTLRKKQMYTFFHRLVHLSLPRIRDFQGLNPLSFDGHGNYSFGIDDLLMFPELNPESVQGSQGLNLSLVTSAKTNNEGLNLLTKLGMPFKDNR